MTETSINIDRFPIGLDGRNHLGDSGVRRTFMLASSGLALFIVMIELEKGFALSRCRSQL